MKVLRFDARDTRNQFGYPTFHRLIQRPLRRAPLRGVPPTGPLLVRAVIVTVCVGAALLFGGELFWAWQAGKLAIR
jgi:hypothetical protein